MVLNMNDGVGQSGKDAETNSSLNLTKDEKRKSGLELFAHSIARIAVAQICESTGFQGFQQLALDTLSDVAVRYIREVGKTANMNANLAGRSECNVFDAIQGLEDLTSVRGFSAASDVHRCLLGSGTVRGIVSYVGYAEEIPFAYPIPGFPVAKDRKQNSSFLQKGEFPPAEHIPSWLPAFPDPRTYTDIPVTDDKGTQIREEGAQPLVAQRGRDSSLSIWKQLGAYDRSQPALSADLGEPLQSKSSKVINPFQRPPLPRGEKDASPVVFPAKLSDASSPCNVNHAFGKNHVSALDTFAPAIEAIKSGQYDDLDDGKKKIPLSRTSSMQFKFGRGWKSLQKKAMSQKNGDNKLAAWFVHDD